MEDDLDMMEDDLDRMEDDLDRIEHRRQPKAIHSSIITRAV